MRRLIIVLLACALPTAPAFAATRNVPVPGFSKLRVEGPYDVRVRTGAAPSLRATGPKDRLDRLMVEARSGTLVVSTEMGWSWHSLHWGKDDAVRIEITVPSLDGVELTGSGDVDIDSRRGEDFNVLLTGSGNLSVGQMEASRLKATVNGSGTLSLGGTAARADLTVMGSGDLDAKRLKVGQLTGSVLGSGDLSVGPTRVAHARLVGSGDISIAGKPSCSTSKTGSGDIRCGG